VCRLEEELDKDAVCHQFLFNLYNECLTKKTLDGFGDFNFGGQIIQTVKYSNELVLMAKEETVLQGMIDKLTEI
jgi:hypothetical protein